MKPRSVGAELFRADKRTDMTKLTVAFRSFANAQKDLSVTKELCGKRSVQNSRVMEDILILLIVSIAHDFNTLFGGSVAVVACVSNGIFN
jgi:hypothetical protein